MFELKKVSIDFKKTLMKTFYFRSCKWLLSQNQQVRTDFSGYRRYEVLAKHIKPFTKQ